MSHFRLSVHYFSCLNIFGNIIRCIIIIVIIMFPSFNDDFSIRLVFVCQSFLNLCICVLPVSVLSCFFNYAPPPHPTPHPSPTHTNTHVARGLNELLVPSGHSMRPRLSNVAAIPAVGKCMIAKKPCTVPVDARIRHRDGTGNPCDRIQSSNCNSSQRCCGTSPT